MKTKSVDLYFFTGTGNTFLAAKKIAEVFKENDIKANLINIEKTDPKTIDLSKIIGLAFPIACWNTYPFIRRFIKNLPNAANTEIFVFSTMGDSSLKAAATIGNTLSKKGYSVIATKGFKMPNNLISVQSEEKNIIKRDMAFIKIKSFTLDMIHKTTKAEKTNIFFKFCFAISSFITSLWERTFFQKIIKFNLAKEKCTKCEICIKICPVENIKMKDYPEFNGNKCQVCMRCISYCPTRAIYKFPIKKIYKGLNPKEFLECFQLKQ